MSDEAQMIRLERTFAHPIRQVFEAWLDGQALAQFMKPAPGTTVHQLSVDPVEGGGFSFVLHVGEAQVPIRGQYGAIEPHTRLQFSWISSAAGERSMVELRFAELDGGSTHLVLEHRGLPSASAVADHSHGWGRIVDSLESMLGSRDSYESMLAVVQAFHDKHDFKSKGGEDLVYRVALMAEELGEIGAAVTKGKPKEQLAEEVADLFILLLGTAISADFDLKAAFWTKMDELMDRQARMVGGRVRVSRFRDDSETSE